MVCRMAAGMDGEISGDFRAPEGNFRGCFFRCILLGSLV